VRSLLLVTRREVVERIGTTSFRVFTLGLFILVLGTIVAAVKAPQIFGQDSFSLGVPADAPEGLTAGITRYADLQNIEVDLKPYANEADAQRMADDGDIDAFLANGTLTYPPDEDKTLTAVVSNAEFSYNLGQQIDSLDLTDAQRQALTNPRQVQVVEQDPGTSDKSSRQFVGFLSALSLYVTLAVYGNWILTGIVEEKASRVVEVLLGLVRPHELLAGKTLGILTVAIGQLIVAVIGGLIGLALVGDSKIPSVALDVVVASIPLFILGLLIYSLVYAAAGAIVSRQTDAQAASTPIVMALLVPYMFAAAFVPQNPDGPVSTVLSIFPLTSPLIMPSRVATGSPGAIELIACYGLLVPAILLVAFIGGRIYAGAILSRGGYSLHSLLGVVMRPNGTS
jgi:ABC-2 type transport system permease protein